MRHFLKVASREIDMKIGGKKRAVLEIYPTYYAGGRDIMKKGGYFYAALDRTTNMWDTNISNLLARIDVELYSYRDKIAKADESGEYYETSGDHRMVVVSDLDRSSTNRLYEFNKWLNNLPPDHAYVQLDTEITFADDEVKPEDYRSKRLPYKIGAGGLDNYIKLTSKIYTPDNLQKIEWSIGSIFTGDSKTIEKMMVLYGAKGTGKSTILDLIKLLFEGYYSVFTVANLVSKSDQFATSAFKDNPLVAIQDDGSLAKIESPIINEFVSHKETTINEKGKRQYTIVPNSFLIVATNELVDIHDTSMGIARRLLDVYPTGDKFPVKEYRTLKANLKYELGAIARHCIEVYKSLGKDYYEGYEPVDMIQKTNYLRNFMMDHYDDFAGEDYVTRNTAYKMYVMYFEESGLGYPPKRIIFGEQLKEYFKEYYPVKWIDGNTERHVYAGLREEKLVSQRYEPKVEDAVPEDWLDLKEQPSIFDEAYKDCPAQYASDKETPLKAWDKVTSKLADIDTRKLHYILPPGSHVTADFDLKDENGNKSFELNKAEASQWPKTYAELSKGGEGIHLEYEYEGDATLLERIVKENVELKVYTGKSSLRRKLTRCNNLPVTKLTGGLPLRKGEKKVLDFKSVKNEKVLRSMIVKCLRKEHHGATKPEVDFIFKLLEDAYASDMKYDVSDMRPDIFAFAFNSSHNSDYCTDLVKKMKFHSEEPSEDKGDYGDDAPIVFFDIEVFPNLLLVVYKYRGKPEKVRMFNPKPEAVERLFKMRLVGFNNRRYDNHILYARSMGYNNKQIYDISQRIIGNTSRNGTFGEAYNLSYADIYDFSSKKQSLKKWEIELGIHHQELGMEWDKPVPVEKWDLVAEYCENDVDATEAVFEARYEDFVARKVLAELSGLTVNDTTRMHATKIIFGDDKHPDLVYTDLSKEFPGYKFENGKSSYMGEDPSEGGYVYAEPGMYSNVALLDVASLHPHSAIELNIFGKYTKRFKEIVDGRLAVKHRDHEAVKNLLNGVLVKYMGSDEQMDALAYALKIVINSVYGYTSAKFDNPFRDPRNVDNIVAKRGSLFMIQLKHAVQAKGFTVAHVKTDSIKIPNATPEIIEYVTEYGKKFGYTFEHEATYDRMCLVNDAVYIARYSGGKHDHEWTATGTQFAVPYVFKTLFSGEPLEFSDFCETKTVTVGELYLDMNEGLPEGQHDYRFVGRAGQFTPIKPGCGGGELFRKADEKYYAAAGTKGYRWLESEVVKKAGKEKDVDESFYKALANAARETVSKYGDFENFVSDDPLMGQPLPDFMNIPETAEEELPFD